MATIISLLFQIQGLDWSNPVHHVETFCGDMAVTKGEWEERWLLPPIKWILKFVHKQQGVSKSRPNQRFNCSARDKFWENCGWQRWPLIKEVMVSFSKHMWICLGKCGPQLLPLIKENRRAIPFDINLDPERMDMLSTVGFTNCLFAVCNSLPGSGFLTAPVCSSWVFLWGFPVMYVCLVPV